MNKPISAEGFNRIAPGPDLQALVEAAGRIVPPLWPLQSAIAVNPLAALEHLPFAKAVEEAAGTFGARASLALGSWRKLLDKGRIERAALRNVAISHLGGLEQAFRLIGPDISRLDLLLARLLEIEPAARPEAGDAFAPADALIAKWCGAFFSDTSGSLMPSRRHGLYQAVMPLLSADRRLAEISVRLAPQPRPFASEPLQGIESDLRSLDVPEQQWGGLLKRLMARLPGWAGHIRWRNEHADPELVRDAPSSAAELLALWTFVLRCAPDRWTWTPQRPGTDVIGELAAHFRIAPDLHSLHAEGKRALEEIGGLEESLLCRLFMEAAERSFRDRLVESINAGACAMPEANRASAQLVFCIDVRSEPLRRAIEGRGSYETLGYAGFFGLPIALRSAGGSSTRNLLPVLLKPAHEIDERPMPGREAAAESTAAIERGRRASRRAFETIKNGIGTSFAAAEAAGPIAAAQMLARCIKPFLRTSEEPGGSEDALMPDRSAIPLGDQIGCAKSFFSMTGVGSNLARLVLLVGHGGHALNNPFASALDCGACGGHRGGANARLLAAILNDTEVRAALSADTASIPNDTVFIAAEHDTTRDLVRLYDKHIVPASHEEELARLEADLSGAGRSCREERARRLGRSSPDLLIGSEHWGEVRPEWGLAGNAAFVVGPRSLTKHTNLEGRVFLHSYDWTTDPGGKALEVILTAPMIVAQWINCQYLFSTIDNERYGAGDKITHNVLGGIGVVQGNGGDLQVGLPRQSLFDDDGTPYHIPQRLLTIVHAPLERIEDVIDRNPILERLFGNGWVQLVAIEPESRRFRCWRPNPTADQTPRNPEEAATGLRALGLVDA